MARTESVRRGCNIPHQNHIAHLFCRGVSRAGSVTVVPCLLVVLLTWTTASAGETGLGIGLKIGAQTLEDPITLDKTTRARLELEIASPLMCDDHLDLAFTFGGMSLGSVNDEYSAVDGGTLIEESYDDDLSLLDVRLAARLYPFGYDKTLRPYVGAGVGYFWFFDQWEYERAETFEDPFFPGTFLTDVDKEKGTDVLARGLFPFVVAGLAIGVSDNVDLLFEFQYDINKEDRGIDLSGPIYMFGGRFRF